MHCCHDSRVVYKGGVDWTHGRDAGQLTDALHDHLQQKNKEINRERLMISCEVWRRKVKDVHPVLTVREKKSFRAVRPVLEKPIPVETWTRKLQVMPQVIHINGGWGRVYP